MWSMSTSRNKGLILLAALAAFAFPAALTAQEYCERYPKECRYALDFYGNSLFRDTVGERSDFDPGFLFAIVAPEMTQYRHLRDIVEQTALFGLYTHNGKDYADFSVGIFQMKPSFLEELEEEVRADPVLRERFPECVFSGEDSTDERRRRIKRLQSPEWQTVYLMLFAEVVEKRFGGDKDERDLIGLYATAYNSGFRKPADELKRMEGRELFPRYSPKKYNYAAVSLWFYDELAGNR